MQSPIPRFFVTSSSLFCYIKLFCTTDFTTEDTEFLIFTTLFHHRVTQSFNSSSVSSVSSVVKNCGENHAVGSSTIPPSPSPFCAARVLTLLKLSVFIASASTGPGRKFTLALLIFAALKSSGFSAPLLLRPT